MKTLLSITLWFSLFGRFLKVLFFPIWLLLPLGVARLRSVVVTKGLIFFIVFILVDLAVRLFAYFAGLPFESRYLYAFVIAAIIISGLGIIQLNDLVYSYVGRRFKWDPRYVVVGIFVVLFFCDVPKALNPQFDKKWLRRIPATIVEHTSPGNKAILISDLREPRIAYYANAEPYKFSNAPNSLEKTSSEGLKTILDDDFGSGIEFSGEKSFVFTFKKPFHRKWSDLVCHWDKTPEGGEMIVQRDQKSPDSGLETIFKGKIAGKTCLSHLRNAKTLKITFILPKNMRRTLLDMRLSVEDRWAILRKGTGYHCEDWFPIEGTGRLCDLVTSELLAHDNVFLLVKKDNKDFEKNFRCKVGSFPFTFIDEFKVKKTRYSLYKKRAKTEPLSIRAVK